MSQVLFVTWDGGGNVPPALAIAAELQARGDVVRFLGHEAQRKSIEAHGFRFEAFVRARPWAVLEARSGPLAPLAFAAVFTDRGMGADIAESTSREPVDYAVIDGLLIGAMAGANRIGLDYSVLVHSLYSVMDASLNRGPLALIMRVKGLNPKRLYASANRIIAATLESLDSADVGVLHTGPMVTGTPAKVEPKPIVLVSLSTTYIAGQREALQAMLDAIAGLPIHAIVTTGPAVDAAELIAPANAELHGFVAHAQLMPRASIVISHGGHATTMLALAHDVPLLIVPMSSTFDQPTIGRIIEQRGAGLALKKTAKAAEIRAALEKMLASDSYRIAAAELGAQIRAHDSAAVAVDALTQVVTETHVP